MKLHNWAIAGGTCSEQTHSCGHTESIIPSQGIMQSAGPGAGGESKAPGDEEGDRAGK